MLPRLGRLVAAALLSATSVLAGSAPPDVQPRIVNGVYTSDHPTVGLLLTGDGPDTADSECTGTLIGCRTFLTAAHCVCNSVGRRCQGDKAPDPSQLFVFLQHAGVYAVERVTVHPSYVFPVADLAVVHLAEPVTAITPTAINRDATPPFGTRGTIVGFGRSGLGNYDYGLKRVGEMRTAACDGDPSDPTWVCWSFDPPVGAPGSDSNICNGDSGGPLFTASDCGDQLTGVTSGAIDAECAAPDRPFDINVFNYREWIAVEAGADLDSVACGTLRHVGESGTDVDGVVGTLSAASPEGHHTVPVPVGTAELRVTMNAVDMGVENFDLYVRPGAAPTLEQFACADTGTSQFADCILTDPTPGTWHLMARRVSGEGTYQITATTIGAGPPASTGSGHCNDGSACTVTDRCLRERCVGTAASDGTPCDDGRLCTGADQCTAGVCSGLPALLTGCTTSGARGSSLTLQGGDPAHDRIGWRWSRGTVESGDLGHPTSDTPYTLCLFDQNAGTPALRLEARVDPGVGWTPKGTGFRYKDKRGAQDGITAVTLRSGAGNGLITLAGKGALLHAPALPLHTDPAVVVQLSSGEACWQASFPTPTKNDDGRFQAKSE